MQINIHEIDQESVQRDFYHRLLGFLLVHTPKICGMQVPESTMYANMLHA